jgi:hypothetical protein
LLLKEINRSNRRLRCKPKERNNIVIESMTDPADSVLISRGRRLVTNLLPGQLETYTESTREYERQHPGVLFHFGASSVGTPGDIGLEVSFPKDSPPDRAKFWRIHHEAENRRYRRI